MGRIMRIAFWWEIQNDRNHWDDPDKDKIILKCIVETVVWIYHA
jgi:hypothetical protein